MKVLRTALFSAFLMICFTNVGYSQLIDDSTHQIDPGSFTPKDNSSEIELIVDQVAYIISAAPEYVVVKFEATAPPNSTITIREESGGTVVFTANLSNWNYPHAVIQMDGPIAEGTLLGCEVCNEDASNCRLIGCITALDTNATGGGN